MHGRRDAVSICDRATPGGIRNFQREMRARTTEVGAVELSGASMRFPEDRWRPKLARRHDSLSCMRRTLVIRAPLGDDGVHALVICASSLRLSAPLRPGRLPNQRRPCRSSAPSPWRRECSFSARSSRSSGIPQPPRDCSAIHGSGQRGRFHAIWAAEKSSPGDFSSNRT